MVDDYNDEPMAASPAPEDTGVIAGSIWKQARSFFAAMFVSVWNGFTEIIPAFVENFWEGFVNLFRKTFVANWDEMLAVWVQAGIMTPETAQEVKQYEKLPYPLDLLSYVFFFWNTVMRYNDQLQYYSSGDLRHSLATQFTPEIPQPQAIIGAAFIAPEKTGEIRHKLKESGFSDEMIDLMFLANYRLYDEMTIRTLFLRGVLSEDEMFMRMRELGYTDTRIKEVINSWEIIPGPQDLLTMVAHEAFEPDSISLMGLEDEFPAEQVQWLKKQGVSEFWARKYWISHWQQPSLQMGFEMLHRGVIGFKELDLLFRTVEIPPYWRDKLTAVAYQPLTRVDSRRMHDLGVLSNDELVKVYMDQGYNEENAVRMARFTIKYNAENDKKLTKQMVVKAYIDGLMNRADALSLLIDAGYKNDQAEFQVVYAEYEQTVKLQEQAVKNVGDRFKNNLITSNDARQRLAAMNLPGARIDVLMDTWQIDVFEDMKVPSKSDLDKFYRNKIITKDDYRLEMQRLGYGSHYIDWYEKLVGMKKAG